MRTNPGPDNEIQRAREASDLLDNGTLLRIQSRGRDVLLALLVTADAETNTTTVSRRRLARGLGISVPTVLSWTRRLELAGLVTSRTRLNGNGGAYKEYVLTLGGAGERQEVDAR